MRERKITVAFTSAVAKAIENARAESPSVADQAGLSKLTYAFVKSVWSLLALLAFMLFSVVIFMGIEGNRWSANNSDLLLEQVEFNKTHSPGGRALMESIPEFDQVYRNYTQIYNLSCRIAKLRLVNWDGKNLVENVWFSSSIISTAGWGIHYPTSLLNKTICMVYAFFGIPLFAIAIGAVARVLHCGRDRKSLKALIKRRCLNYRIFTFLVAAAFTTYIVLYGFLMKQYVKWKYNTLGTNITLGDKVLAAGHLTEWSLIAGIYNGWINGFTLVGFGDLWPYADHSIEDQNHTHVAKLVAHMVHFAFVIFVIAVVKWAFDLLSNQIDETLEDRLQKTISVRQPRTSSIREEGEEDTSSSEDPSYISHNKSARSNYI